MCVRPPTLRTGGGETFANTETTHIALIPMRLAPLLLLALRLPLLLPLRLLVLPLPLALQQQANYVSLLWMIVCFPTICTHYDITDEIRYKITLDAGSLAPAFKG